MARSDRWTETKYFPIGFTYSDPDLPLHKLREAAPRRQYDRPAPGILPSLIGTARELILDRGENSYEFIIVGFSFDSEYMDLALAPHFSILNLTDDNDVKEILAIAMVCDVPVYPEDDEIAVDLARLHADLFAHGFTTQDKSGKELRLRPAFERGIVTRGTEIRYLPTESMAPADLLVVRERLQIQAQESAEAARVLALLRAAISELDNTLKNEQCDESALQNCLTTYPVLFGLEYERMQPQYRLGSEYVMDYALIRPSGLVDLVEIERSSHKLYKDDGNPTAALVHAEQQILDWLDWLEKHSEYGRSKLEGLMSPQAYIIIGRSPRLSTVQHERLQRRNLSWRGTLFIYTYDDLLKRAQNILKVLTTPVFNSPTSAESRS